MRSVVHVAAPTLLIALVIVTCPTRALSASLDDKHPDAQSIAALEGADHAIAFASGLSAITASLLAFAKVGDHVLVTDAVYGPARRFCDQVLMRFGVEVTTHPPRVPYFEAMNAGRVVKPSFSEFTAPSSSNELGSRPSRAT